MSTEKRNTPDPSISDDTGDPLGWISLIANTPSTPDVGEDDAREQLLKWWNYSTEGISRLHEELPEEFRTTRIWRQIKYAENYSTRLKPVFTDSAEKACSLKESEDRLRKIFSGDEDRLAQWKSILENIRGLIPWLHSFRHARDYLLASFPLRQEHADALRLSLIRSVRDPYPFLEEETRNRFDDNFLEFKNIYIANYGEMHETMRHAIRDVKKEESNVDPVALKNLELLSRLLYTDKSYLNRINILATWIKRNQCTLPVADILQRYPRCYCNFNPCLIRQPAAPVEKIKAIVRDGIRYFQTVLVQCRDRIEKEARSRNMDHGFCRQIDAFIENGSASPIEDQTIESVNQIFRKHPAYFHSAISPED
jgi:hypothetical protein